MTVRQALGPGGPFYRSHAAGRQVQSRLEAEGKILPHIKYNQEGGSIERWIIETPINSSHSMYTFILRDSGGNTSQRSARYRQPDCSVCIQTVSLPSGVDCIAL